MKKLTKKDLLYIWIISLSFLGLVYILSNTTYLYGSTLDWYSEHVSIPEYFRTLFYSTHDLFPDFALNLGSGQNIYNFSYYGLLSPTILVSYLLPFVSMTTYIITSTIIIVIISAFILYTFLKNKDYSSEVCFLSTLAFIFSTAISVHSHRHIMFINYMPFLLLGLFGVDKVFDNKKSWLLTLSVFLMIMTSYYFSVGGICCIFLYALYRYLKQVKKVTFKTMFNTFIHILRPVIVAIFCSAIITLPTLATLINNRAASNITITLKNLLLPKIGNVKNIIFNYYGLGLTAFIIPGLINLFTKEKHNKIFSLILCLIAFINIFNYILNGTMYIDSKSLIPLLPLYIIVLAELFKDIFNKNIKYKITIPVLIIFTILIIISRKYLLVYLIHIIVFIVLLIIYNLSNKRYLFIIPTFILLFATCLHFNQFDTLELKYGTRENEKLVKGLINDITDNDDSIYRISNNIYRTSTPNKNYNNINYYNSTIYSSISNQKYNSFYYDIAMNNIPARNRALTVSSSNILYLFFSSNKYYISEGKGLLGYELINSEKGINVYNNDQVLPLAYASSNIMSYDDFDKLSIEQKQEALLKVVVADAKSNNDFIPNIEEMELDIDEILSNENITKEDNGSYTIDVQDKLKIKYPLPEKYQNKILFIRFNMNRVDEEKDLSIIINSVKNKLTNKKWKYYNGNTVFDYVLAFDGVKDLNISFTEGKYNISDFEFYYLDYAYLEKLNDNINPLIIDKDKTKGDIIIGEIDVTKDGYFIMSVPYDNGFNIKVDNKKVKCEQVNESFVGFKISEGHHKVEIEYNAPLKNVAIIMSIIGFISFGVTIFIESKIKIC